MVCTCHSKLNRRLRLEGFLKEKKKKKKKKKDCGSRPILTKSSQDQLKWKRTMGLLVHAYHIGNILWELLWNTRRVNKTQSRSLDANVNATVT
jgi:hypothetical protein